MRMPLCFLWKVGGNGVALAPLLTLRGGYEVVAKGDAVASI